MLFSIYINDMFFTLNEIDICNFADDTTPYVCDSNLKSVLEKLEHNSELAIAWFEMNYMKFNNDKCHLLISGNKNEYMWENLDQDIVWESTHVEPKYSCICLKANRKLSTLTRVAKFVPFKKRHIVFKRFI